MPSAQLPRICKVCNDDFGKRAVPLVNSPRTGICGYYGERPGE